jgi:hypothetical protein
VLWKNAETGTVLDGPFQGGVAYKAEVTLSPTTDYSFTGTGKDFFTHTDAEVINNPVNSGIVTIRFAALGLISFGPATADGSALKLLKEKKGERSLTVELPGGDEVVTGNSVTLSAGINSPAQVVIDGHDRLLTIAVGGDRGKRGKLLTVGNGVTLTLQNITLWGTNENDSPLVEVESGGTLILGTGVVLNENRSSGDAGGVWVNGGKLIMNAGSEIKNMTAQQAGGVLISAGEFIMNDGIIQENSVVPNKKAVISGGVFNAGGTFIMNNGFIYKNTIYHDRRDTDIISGMAGGVFNGEKGVFTMNNGAIVKNSVESKSDVNTVTSIVIGGGVFNLNATFTMNNGFIQENSANTAADYAGGSISGGVFNREGTFFMNHGVIRKNEAAGGYTSNTGGGVFNGYLGIFNMNGGTIGGEDYNTNRAVGEMQGANGVYNDNIFTMSGGIITGNVGERYSPNDKGVFNGGTFIMTGPAKVAQNNRVNLFTDKCITINGNLTASPPVANIKYLDGIRPGNTRQTLLSANTPDLVTENYTKFYYDGEPGLISGEGKYIHTQAVE